MKKIIIALTLIIIASFISFFYFKNDIEEKERIELSTSISDSALYGFSDSNLSKIFKKYYYLNLYNFMDTNIFKNHTFKYSFNEIQKKYPLIDSLWVYVYGTRYCFCPSFYVDSNYIYGMLVYFPLDSTDKYGCDFKLLSGSSIFKIYQVRQGIESIKEGQERLKETDKSYNEKTDFDRKFDSLKAVLKR